MSTDEPRRDGADRPLASILLIAYNQQSSVREAIAGALAQTYSPLEIVISDDASSDATFAAMQQAAADYRGPHRLLLNRNPVNLGIGGHLSRVVDLSKGEMLFIAAGDDVSLPERCERVMQAWTEQGRSADLIATALLDIDADGQVHGTVVPSDLATYRNAADWLARPPFVVGAAQAWTRRLFDRYGPLPRDVMGEDLIMVFRAIGAGGAFTLRDPLVRYRRGGSSGRVRGRSASDVIGRLKKNGRHALAELPQLLADAETMGQLDTVRASLEARLARERFIHEVFDARSTVARWRAIARARDVGVTTRLRIGLYALWPGAFAPFFWLKRALNRAASGSGSPRDPAQPPPA